MHNFKTLASLSRGAGLIEFYLVANREDMFSCTDGYVMIWTSTRFIQVSLCKIQGLFKDLLKTFLLFSRTENFWKF